MDCYLANLCPLGCYVVNEVRRLADYSLSHKECLNARHTPADRQRCSNKRSDRLSKTNFERKRMMVLSTLSVAIILENWPVNWALSLAIWSSGLAM